MGEIISGKIISHDERGLLIAATYDTTERAVKRQYEDVLIELIDGRTISPEQRRKAHAIIAEIADWMGDLPDYVKRMMKIEFMADRIQSLEKNIFSLSDCSITVAREFISYLIDFVLRFQIPTKVPLYELCDDIPQYVYACLMNKKCSVCGKSGGCLHHAFHDKIGMGGDRTEKPQLGAMVICLCTEHHGEAHQHGDAALFKANHLAPIPLNEEISKKFKLTKKAQRDKT